MEFFDTVIFGVLAMVIVGGSWCLTGLVMGDAPKRGIEPSLVQFFGACFSVAAGTVIMVCTKIPHCSWKIAVLTCGAYAVGGFINFFMLQLMSYAMQRGPNGIIWSIIQSAMIFPFLGGIVFFHMETNWRQWSGLVLVVIALILFALSKDNSGARRGWLLPAFICLGMCGVQQNLVNAPAYFESARAINSITRSLSGSVGTLLAATIYNLVRMNAVRWEQLRRNIGNLTLWKYVGALQLFGLFFAYLLFYPGMNTLADHGLGGISWPLMVGSCIVSFLLCSFLILKEKINLIQVVAVVSCVLGLVGLCLK